MTFFDIPRQSFTTDYERIMMDVDIKYFFRSGRLGQVELGMSKTTIEESVGEPDYWMIGQIERNQKDDSPIWRYGNIEFHFNSKNELISIFNDHLMSGSIYGGHKIRLEPWFLKEKYMSFQEVVTILTEAKMDFEVAEPPGATIEAEAPSLHVLSIKLKSGIELMFANEDDDYNCIEKREDIIWNGTSQTT